MNLKDVALSVYQAGAPAPGSQAEKQAIDAACNLGFNSLDGEFMPDQFEDKPLLKEWYVIGSNARAGFVFPANRDESRFGR